MKTTTTLHQRAFPLRVLVLAISLPVMAIAEIQGDPEPTILPPLNAKSASAEKIQYPDFAVPDDKLEEIKSASPMTADERDLLESLSEAPVGRLIELLEVYDRLDNRAMVQAIAEVVQKKAPNSPELARLRRLTSDTESVRRPDYLDAQAEALLKGSPATDAEAIDAQARYLLQRKQIADAAHLLEKLREVNFKGRAFPYLDTLASCYFDLKRWNDAAEAWATIQKQSIFPDALRERAALHITNIRLEQRIELAREKTYANPDDAVRLAKTILAEVPEQPAAIAFYVDSLHYAGRDDEALAYVKEVQANWKGRTVFPYQRLLAHCEMNLKEWDRAKEAFGAILSDPAFDENARKDARRSIELSDVARQGEAALLAAEKGEEEEARGLIAAIKREHPGDIEALGYEATVRARLGEKDEALKMIEDKKHEMFGRGPFALQDTLGGIYIERKEFGKAREAFTAICNDKRYDWDERRIAIKGLQDVRKAELLDVAYRAIQNRHPSRARIALDTLRTEFGAKWSEAEVLEAEILLAENKVLPAKAALTSIEERTPPTKVFSAQTSLASAHLRSGDWEKSIQRYREIIRRPLSVSPSELLQARWEVREAILIARPAIVPVVSYRKDDDGSVLRMQTTYQSPWQGAWRASAFARFNQFDLNNPPSLGSLGGNQSYTEGGAIIQRTFGPQLAGEIMAGLSDDEPIYGARIGNFINPGLQWSAAFKGNARSSESTVLEAAGARENRAEVRFAGSLGGPWNVDLSAYAFWMNLAGEDLGDGFGANALVEYVLQTETPSRPEIGVGYLGRWQRFTSSKGNQQALFDGLANQHGLQIETRKAVSDRLRLSASTSAYYSFDEAVLGYAFGLGMQYYLTDSTAVFADVRYNSENSSAQSSQGTGSGALEASLGASVAF